MNKKESNQLAKFQPSNRESLYQLISFLERSSMEMVLSPNMMEKIDRSRLSYFD